jgi:Flp pilus assembly pilin Flp
MAEYAVVLGVITLAVVGIFAALGTGIGSKITALNAKDHGARSAAGSIMSRPLLSPRS